MAPAAAALAAAGGAPPAPAPRRAARPLPACLRLDLSRPAAPRRARRRRGAPPPAAAAVPRSAPPLTGGGGGGPPPPAPRPPPPPPSPARAAFKQLLRQLANLKLAIAELAAVAALSAVGTVIEQGQQYAYYVERYPNEGPKALGFVSADLIWALQWDHVYSADYFLGLLALLAASIAACTATTQWPAAKVAQRWRFRGAAPAAYARLPVARALPRAALRDVGAALAARGYQVFVKPAGGGGGGGGGPGGGGEGPGPGDAPAPGGQLYAFKGLAGKVGPIGVHASMLAVMAGVAGGALGGWTGSVMVPEGGAAPLGAALRPASPLARPPRGAAAVLRVGDFRVDYRPDGSVRQFYTDAAVVGGPGTADEGRELARATVSVNAPLRYGGVTAYQTDWALAAVTVEARRAADGAPLAALGGGGGGAPSDPAAAAAARAAPQRVNLPMASLGKGDEKLFAAFLPVEAPPAGGGAPRGVSILARDLQSVALYDSAGKFAGVRRPESGRPIVVDGVEVVVRGVLASTGLELKADPGVPLVYAGFGGMCVTTVASYLSHSQVWAAQAPGGAVLLGGRTNRAKVAFERELEELLEGVPETGAGGGGGA